jgi:branched-chain amino acid transport system permease protein
VLVGCVPLVTKSGVMLNFVMMALYATLIAQAWNILGGFGGQFSFGHALFFGTGAYVQAIAQLQGGINAWVALPLAIVGAALVGLFVGALTFRYGLKGSYFALVTLAFAEVFRIVALSVPFTGGGVGLMVPLRESVANMQFASRAGYLWVVLAMVAAGLLVTWWLRNGRFGAYLQAVRDNEDAARAVGVNPFRVKLGPSACRLRSWARPARSTCRCSSTSTRASPTAGTPRWRRWSRPSSAAWARCGARCWARSCCTCCPTSRATCSANCPGINMVIYGTVLVLIVIFVPRGVAGPGCRCGSCGSAKGGRND